MANVSFKNISKHFGNFTAVKNLDLEVKDQEFLCLVGPSGCGKTTTLRMLAGLEEISEGTISIEEKIVNDIPSKDRDIAMVFQSYALYPHYTIYDNLAFGLRTRFSSKSESLVRLLMILFYTLVVGIYYGVCALLGLISALDANLFFGAGIFGGLIVIVLFPEVRKDIKQYLIAYAAKFNESIKHYMENEKEIEQKVQDTAELLGIKEQLWKKPKQLSGGQRQRVALGRAIIRNPKVFLMDEPLSNLDAKLRVQMRAELERLTDKLKVTSIYVTHDQIEAMTLGDRIAVLNEGVLQQVGAPFEVYNHPQNLFVAGFIGSPSMNLIKGDISEKDGQLQFESPAFSYPIPNAYSNLRKHLGTQVTLGVRPEHIKIKREKADGSLQATVGVLEPIGSDTFIYLDFPDDTELICKEEGIPHYKINIEVQVLFDIENLHFFDTTTELRINPTA
ncbi:MAG: ABC transporter ATP-binding protein [Promethearchaeota archaeon]